MFFISFFRNSDKSRKSKRKNPLVILMFAGVLTVSLLAIWAVYKVNFVPSAAYCEGVGEYSLVASTDYEREQFFAQFGYSAESLEHFSVSIPCGGETFEEYNSLQQSQGLDLKPYMGKQAHQYTLRLTGKNLTEETFGVLTVYRDRVVAVHLTDLIPGRPVRALAG